jgi:hypothetical protein
VTAVSEIPAEHVEIINYQVAFCWIPSAFSSITLRFLDDYHWFHRSSVCRFLSDQPQVDMIKLYKCSHQMVGQIDQAIWEAMRTRARDGNNRDFTIGISRDGHEQTENHIEWRVYRAKDFVKSDENLVESDDGEYLSCQIYRHSRY